MSLRYQKRVNLGKGVGLNISSSGISSSLRTKYGSIGTRGFSIKTGIPGLTFRSTRSKKGNDAIVFLLIMFFIFFALVAWNVILFIIWASKEIIHFIQRKNLERKMKKELVDEENLSTIDDSQ